MNMYRKKPDWWNELPDDKKAELLMKEIEQEHATERAYLSSGSSSPKHLQAAGWLVLKTAIGLFLVILAFTVSCYLNPTAIPK